MNHVWLIMFTEKGKFDPRVEGIYGTKEVASNALKDLIVWNPSQTLWLEKEEVCMAYVSKTTQAESPMDVVE